MRYRVLTKEEFDISMEVGIIESTSEAYWNSTETGQTETCMVPEMLQFFGKEIPRYYSGISWRTFTWKNWMVRPYNFKPEILNDVIILSKANKRDLKDYYAKESLE